MSRRFVPTGALFRGDSSDGVAVPEPESRTSIVEHVLYLGGYGRSTPFTSTTESEDVAEHFAAKDGAVWMTDPSRAIAAAAKHWSKRTLLENLRGFGKGRAKWNSQWEVAQARRYVEQWSEHLLEWTERQDPPIAERVRVTFDKRSKRRSR